MLENVTCTKQFDSNFIFDVFMISIVLLNKTKSSRGLKYIYINIQFNLKNDTCQQTHRHSTTLSNVGVAAAKQRFTHIVPTFLTPALLMLGSHLPSLTHAHSHTNIYRKRIDKVF